MAVQQNRVSRSRRDMRRAHDALGNPKNLTTDAETGETHLRHHITPSGRYRGRQVIAEKEIVADDE